MKGGEPMGILGAIAVAYEAITGGGPENDKGTVNNWR